MKYHYSPVCLLLFSLFSFNAHAEINKWVDENNQVHYSDQPAPDSTKASSLKVPAAATGAEAQKTTAEREVELKKAQKAKEEAAEQEAKVQETARINQKYCEDSRVNLKTLENSRRVTTYNAQGQPVYMDDAARQQRIDEVRRGLEANCK